MRMIHLKSKRFIAVLVVLLIGIGATAPSGRAAPDPNAAMQFVQSGLDELIAVLQEADLPKSEKTRRLRNLLRRDFDVAAIGRFALGAHRRGLSPAKLEAYQKAFEEHVVETYIARLVQYVGPPLARLAKDIIKVSGTRPAGKRDLFVRTGIARVGETAIAVDWRVRERDGRMKIIDAYFLGVSLALTYKQEFASVIQKRGKGVDGLIEALEEKAVTRAFKR